MGAAVVMGVIIGFLFAIVDLPGGAYAAAAIVIATLACIHNKWGSKTDLWSTGRALAKARDNTLLQQRGYRCGTRRTVHRRFIW